MDKPQNKSDPERTARKIVMDCADCDCCRPIMDESCLFFPELYRLYDQEVESGRKISPAELRQLVEKCNFCALCPCPNIRADIMRAKTQFIERDGLKFGVRAKDLNPELLVTDCLSCRLQFKQLLPNKVFHPVEILWEAYKWN
jgi:glycerol-3-phosphate dehydrogenase subunit C